jgi:uncharacterized protein YjbI with pentapeptide repeats
MKTKIEIKDISGNILFTHECEDNSVKKTLEEAVRQRTDLRGADLCGAYLMGAYLSGADLSDANLSDAYLNFTNLYYANIPRAILSRANFEATNLCVANLRFADLNNTDLRFAYLNGADLYGAKNVPFIPLACPSDGAFIGWKKVNECLVKLLIPEDAERISATTNRCRCDKAKVLEITNLKTNEHLDEITDREYAPCVYKVGEMVYPDYFNVYRWGNRSHGIYFYINRQEAVEY